jgi:hypothetical protein
MISPLKKPFVDGQVKVMRQPACVTVNRHIVDFHLDAALRRKTLKSENRLI